MAPPLHCRSDDGKAFLQKCWAPRCLGGGCVQESPCTGPSPRGERWISRARGLLRAESDVFAGFAGFSARRTIFSPRTGRSPRRNAQIAAKCGLLRAETPACTGNASRSARRGPRARGIRRAPHGDALAHGKCIALRAETPPGAPRASRSARKRRRAGRKHRSPRGDAFAAGGQEAFRRIRHRGKSFSVVSRQRSDRGRKSQRAPPPRPHARGIPQLSARRRGTPATKGTPGGRWPPFSAFLTTPGRLGRDGARGPQTVAAVADSRPSAKWPAWARKQRNTCLVFPSPNRSPGSFRPPKE